MRSTSTANRFVFKKGDYVQFDAGTGSYGRVEEIVYPGADWVTQRYHVRWSYGRDVNGKMMHGTSRYVKGTEIKHITRKEFKLNTDKDGWGKPKP